MASPDAIRRALLNLLGAKSLDRSAKKQGLSGGAEFPTDDYQVGRARQQAREVQGVDPLKEKFPGEEILPGNGEPDYLHRYVRNRPEKDPARLPDSEARINEERLRGFQDDGTNPFSKDLDTFPDDALSDPAEAAFSRKFEQDRLEGPGGPLESTELDFYMERAVDISAPKLEVEDAYARILALDPSGSSTKEADRLRMIALDDVIPF